MRAKGLALPTVLIVADAGAALAEVASSQETATSSQIPAITPFSWESWGVIVLAFFAFLILLQVIPNIVTKQGWGPQAIRLFILTLTIAAALFLVAVGVPQSQTAPVYSLLGVVLGYLFGQSAKSEDSHPNKPGPPGPGEHTEAGNEGEP